MDKTVLCSRKTAKRAVLALILTGQWLPAPARADIFVSNGAGSTTAGDVWSYSQYTGSPKQTFTGGLASSEGMALGPDGNLYVADGVNRSVLRFNPSTGAFLGTFVSPISNPSFPFGITFGPDGSLYMADNFGLIRRFDGTSGAPTGAFSCSPPSGGSCYPFGLTFGPDGNLYVSDAASRGILKLNGSTLAYMGQFVPPYPNTSTFPWGLHFGPNGNLYAVFDVPVGWSPYPVNNILQFNGTSGAQVPFVISETGQADFAFGADGKIYVASNNGFSTYSAGTGGLLGQFGSTGLPPNPPGFILIGGPGALGVLPYLVYNPISIAPPQTLRITVVNGPIRVPPGVPVQAQLGFRNSLGASIGPSAVVNLNPGQSASLDVNASTLISSGRIQLQPVVSALPGAPIGSLQGSVELITTSSGIGSVFYPGIPVPPLTSITGLPSFVPQGAVRGQSMQINAMAPPDSPCVALLSFEDVNGSPVGPTQTVNLAPGTMASLIFNTNAFTKTGRAEFVPQITPTNPVGAGPATASACLGSVEVFNQRTSETATYQISSPDVGTSPAVP